MDAELLLAHAVGTSRTGLLTLAEVPDDAAARFAALLDQLPEPGRVVGVEVVEREQPAARDSEDVRQEELGVDPWRLHPGVAEAARGVGQRGADAQEPAASSSAVFAASRASMTASRSPSILSLIHI